MTNREVEVSIGHRWGAAFPNRNCSTEQYTEMLNQLQGDDYVTIQFLILILILFSSFLGKAVDDAGRYKHCYINKNVNFIAAGDYFHDDDTMLGTIESSFLSSQAAVNEVVD